MFYYKYGNYLFFKNIILSLILAVQIAVSIFLCSMTISKVENLENNILIFEQIQETDGLYVMPAVELAYGSNFNEEAKKIEGVKDVVKIYTSFAENPNYDLRFLHYDDFIIENCKFPLSKGIWLTEYDGTGLIPVVVDREMGAYKLGKQFSANNKDYIIIGVLGKREQYVSFSCGGNNENISTLVENYDGIGPMFLTRSQDFEKSFLDESMDDTNFIVVFDENLSPSKRAESVQKFNDYGFTKSIADLYSDGVSEINTQITSLSPYIIISFLLSILGVSSSIALMTLKEAHNFSVFYICGVDWKKIQKILFVYLINVFVLSICIYLILYLLCINMEILSYYDLIFTFKSLMATGLVFLIIFISSMIPIKKIFKKTQPINILHKNFNE